MPSAGVKIIQTACLDVREIKPAHFGLFDHILLDVPRSGLGVIRRKPDNGGAARRGYYLFGSFAAGNIGCCRTGVKTWRYAGL